MVMTTAVAVPTHHSVPVSPIDLALLPQPWLCQYDDPGVDYAGDPAEDCEQDVEDELQAAACAQQDGEGWEEDGDDCFAAADLCAGQHTGNSLSSGNTYDYHVCG